MRIYSNAEPPYQWSFSLVDEIPVPSVGDAAEFIEDLGFDPWSFTRIDLVSDAREGKMIVSEFVVVGSQAGVEALRNAHDLATRSNTLLPQPEIPVAWFDFPG